MKLNYTIKKSDNYSTIKDVLITYFKISHRLLIKLKNNNCIFINNNNCIINDTIKTGDLISVSLNYDEEISNIVPTKMNLDIIYEDDYYLIINKPFGIPVHPSLLHYEDSLSNGVRFYFNSIGLNKKIRPVNRIDKDTSGIVIFAKNEYIQENLVRQMKSKNFEKEYIAIVEGYFKEKNGTIFAPIDRKENSIIERCVNNNGMPSITKYEVLKELLINNIPISAIKCILETGRTHQIRVHMAYINHPLLGDTLYNNNPHLDIINRQALHSYKVSFIHPITNEKVCYKANIPKDLMKFF